MSDIKQIQKNKRIQRQIIGIFVVVGLAVLILGFLNLRSNLKKPFISYYTNYNKLTDEQEQTDALLALRAKDSDGDGLTDYDELYQYKTSPYIADSDSDGYDDNTEISSGYDPNCPKGQDCKRLIDETSTNTNSASTNTDTSEELTPEHLRQVLIANGVSQADLDLLDDATLMEYYQEAINESNQDVEQKYSENTNETDPNAELLNTNQSTNNTASVGSLQNLSADDLRKLLINTGDFSEADLATIDDDQLMSIYQESIK
ncbi:MAG: hypothetical protein V1898_03590 [Patescibacteria group bacterium]